MQALRPEFSVLCPTERTQLTTLRTLQQCDVSFDLVSKCVKGQLVNGLRDDFYAAQAAERQRSKSEPKGKPICCACYWKQDMEKRAAEKAASLENRGLGDHADTQFMKLHLYNDERAQRFRERFSAVYLENQARARSAVVKRDTYRKQGRYMPEDYLLENTAVLQDAPDLQTTLRKRNEYYMEQQVKQAEEARRRQYRTQERLEDYINRKGIEIELLEQYAQDKEFSLEKQRSLQAIYQNSSDKCTLGEILHKQSIGAYLDGIFAGDNAADSRFAANNNECKADNFANRGNYRQNEQRRRIAEKCEERYMLVEALRQYRAEDEYRRAGREAARLDAINEMAKNAQRKLERACRPSSAGRSDASAYRFALLNGPSPEICEYH